MLDVTILPYKLHNRTEQISLDSYPLGRVSWGQAFDHATQGLEFHAILLCQLDIVQIYTLVMAFVATVGDVRGQACLSALGCTLYQLLSFSTIQNIYSLK